MNNNNNEAVLEAEGSPSRRRFFNDLQEHFDAEQANIQNLPAEHGLGRVEDLMEVAQGSSPAIAPAASGSSPSSASSELSYSGLYSYHISTNSWTLLGSDVASPKPTTCTIRSRVGHSMLFHPVLFYTEFVLKHSQEF